MKRYMQIVGVILAITISSIAHAWTYTFINNDHVIPKMGIRVKLSGRNEPWYYGVIDSSGGRYTFEFGVNKQVNLNLEGTQKEYTGRKVGFCLEEVQMMPYRMVKGTLQPTNNWIRGEIQSVDKKAFGRMVQVGKTGSVTQFMGWAIGEKLKPKDTTLCANRTFIISTSYSADEDEMNADTLDTIMVTFERD